MRIIPLGVLTRYSPVVLRELRMAPESLLSRSRKRPSSLSRTKASLSRRISFVISLSYAMSIDADEAGRAAKLAGRRISVTIPRRSPKWELEFHGELVSGV